jgi:hypothetical protein
MRTQERSDPEVAFISSTAACFRKEFLGLLRFVWLCVGLQWGEFM